MWKMLLQLHVNLNLMVMMMMIFILRTSYLELFRDLISATKIPFEIRNMKCVNV